MQIHSVIQNTPPWLKLRATCDTASEAAAANGQSKNTRRSDLLKQKHTGLVEEVGTAKQSLFDKGHQAESEARVLAEAIVDTDLYPITGTLEVDGLNLLASMDGASMDGEIIWEHKLFSEKLAADVKAGTLEPHYTIQMDQQLLVSGAKKCLFMTSDGTADKMAWCWYESSPEKFAALIAGWKQFRADLATYTPVEAAPVATATPTLGLPAVSIQVNGSIALIDNLDVFGAALTAYIAGLNLKPETDQDFADLEGAVKAFKKAEDALEAAENGALAQTASIDTMRRTVAQYKELARVNRLMADKLVKSEKDNRRIAIVTKARAAFDTHVASLNTSLGKPYMPTIAADFGGVVKGLKTITSIQNSVDTELARVKIEANATADRIRLNLGTLRELAADHTFLFADTAQIVLKQPDDLMWLVKARIAEHQAAEAAKEAATRERIRAEEQAKAEAAVREVERVKAEEVARLVREAEAQTALEARLATADQREQARQAEIAGAVLQVRAAQDAAPAANVVPITRAAPAPQAEPATPPTLKLGEIGTRLGFSLTGDFLKTLGFEPAARDKSALLFHEASFSHICAALVAHINIVQAQRAA